MELDRNPVRRRKVATFMMLAFTVGWAVLTVGIQLYQAHRLGYGSGLGDGGRLPQELARIYGDDVRAAVAASSHNAPKIGALEDAGRLLFSILCLLGIMKFWHIVMSRIGTF